MARFKKMHFIEPFDLVTGNMVIARVMMMNFKLIISYLKHWQRKKNTTNLKIWNVVITYSVTMPKKIEAVVNGVYLNR